MEILTMLLLFWRLHLLSRWNSPTVSVPPHQATMELATGIDTLAICDHRSSSSPSTSSLPSSSSSECEAAGGTASGTCASSFGVCCVFRSPLFVKQNPLYSIISNLYYIIPPLSIACGATMNQNNSYAIISSYSTRFTITGSLYLRS